MTTMSDSCPNSIRCKVMFQEKHQYKLPFIEEARKYFIFYRNPG